jgi:hypothetical protein
MAINNKKEFAMKNSILILSLVTLLSGCGNGSSSKTGTLNLAVSDAPADAQIVNIAFKQVVLKSDSGSYSFDVSGDNALKHIDLVTFSGLKTSSLVSNEQINVGEYQLCIYIKNNKYSDQEPDSPTSSFVKDPDGNIVGLTTPSEGACGGGVGADEEDTGRLFINKKFTISAGENSYIAEFDLNKVLMEPTGGDTFWTLKPTGIELFEAGSISGTISKAFSDECASELGHAVYLYPGNVALENMLDLREDPAVAPEVAPIARSIAIINDAGDYEYEFPAVYEGSYSLGYTCMADNDLADENNIADAFIIYAAQQDIAVAIGTTTTVDFNITP